MGKLLDADNLVLIADTQEECISKLKVWKSGMENKGLCVNMKKSKFLVSGHGHDVLTKSGMYPCANFTDVLLNIDGLVQETQLQCVSNGVTSFLH